MIEDIAYEDIQGKWFTPLSVDHKRCETGCGRPVAERRMMCLEHCDGMIALSCEVGWHPKDNQAWLDQQRRCYLPDPEDQSTIWGAW